MFNWYIHFVEEYLLLPAEEILMSINFLFVFQKFCKSKLMSHIRVLDDHSDIYAKLVRILLKS